MNDATID